MPNETIIDYWILQMITSFKKTQEIVNYNYVFINKVNHLNVDPHM